ncbi:transporter associated domain-containing protein [Streptomyces sp. CA-210063]|uniref:transporter associated domain-containing protein n=1 Tax=Streptomyces sp. CA-210063 TaxID=2801029 RepID=UPI003FA71E12
MRSRAAAPPAPGARVRRHYPRRIRAAHRLHPPRPRHLVRWLKPATDDGRHVWEADGSIRTDELAEIGLSAEDGPYETLAGLTATLLERIPKPGDTVHSDGWDIIVRDVDHHRADRLILTAPAADRAEQESAR